MQIIMDSDFHVSVIYHKAPFNNAAAGEATVVIPGGGVTTSDAKVDTSANEAPAEKTDGADEAAGTEGTDGAEGTDGTEGTGGTEGTDAAGGMEGMEMGEGMEVPSPKPPLMANWFFVIGISAVTFVVGSIIGIVLAKRKIKKGIDLYED